MLFVYNYIFRLGILDGKAGFVYHWMYQRWYRTLVDAKILEREMGGEGTGNRKPSPGASAEAGEGGSPKG
jgi:hypothetical protein